MTADFSSKRGRGWPGRMIILSSEDRDLRPSLDQVREPDSGPTGVLRKANSGLTEALRGTQLPRSVITRIKGRVSGLNPHARTVGPKPGAVGAASPVLLHIVSRIKVGWESE